MMRPAIDDPFPGVDHIVVHPDPLVSGYWTAQFFGADGQIDILDGSYPNLGCARFDALMKWDPVNRALPVAVVSQYHMSNTETITQ